MNSEVLTPLQRDVITELQKVLLTLNQINDSLLKTIKATGAEVQGVQRETVEVGKLVFETVLRTEGE